MSTPSQPFTALLPRPKLTRLLKSLHALSKSQEGDHYIPGKAFPPDVNNAAQLAVFQDKLVALDEDNAQAMYTILRASGAQRIFEGGCGGEKSACLMLNVHAQPVPRTASRFFTSSLLCAIMWRLMARAQHIRRRFGALRMRAARSRLRMTISVKALKIEMRQRRYWPLGRLRSSRATFARLHKRLASRRQAWTLYYWTSGHLLPSLPSKPWRRHSESAQSSSSTTLFLARIDTPTCSSIWAMVGMAGRWSRCRTRGGLGSRSRLGRVGGAEAVRSCGSREACRSETTWRDTPAGEHSDAPNRCCSFARSKGPYGEDTAKPSHGPRHSVHGCTHDDTRLNDRRL